MKLKTKLSGFTFLELIIIISIIGIGASVAIVSLNSSKNYTKLKAAQADIATSIKMAQSYSLQGKTQPGEKVCGYGFRFQDNTHYSIYYIKLHTVINDNCGEQNINQIYRSFLSAGEDNTATADQAYALSDGVELSSSIEDAVIFFDIPSANVYNKDGLELDAPISLEFECPPGSGDKKSITMNELGLITED
jgi:type II secretory pathway pseudopilin PulG